MTEHSAEIDKNAVFRNVLYMMSTMASRPTMCFHSPEEAHGTIVGLAAVLFLLKKGPHRAYIHAVHLANSVVTDVPRDPNLFALLCHEALRPEDKTSMDAFRKNCPLFLARLVELLELEDVLGEAQNISLRPI
ncbi:MAG: hypothetical protein R3C19_07380 [Planctomycetaceae bacterium]